MTKYIRKHALGDLPASCYTHGCIRYTCGMPIRVDTAGKTIHGRIYFRGSAGEMLRSGYSLRVLAGVLYNWYVYHG